MAMRPNKQEFALASILNELVPNEFKYVGDGGLVIDGKCPDFTNGDHKLIELYGDYFHRGQNPQKRIDFFKERGYDCCVVWEHELRDLPALEAKIMSFVGKVLCNNQNTSEVMLPKKIGG
jgi:very-short-patch-repair endonuclease